MMDDRPREIAGERDEDWVCRNCGFRFIPTYWVPGVGSELNGQCPNCRSNATHPAEARWQEVVEDGR